MIYLDNAATSFPKPSVVYEACDEWLRKQPAAFGRGSHRASQHASSLVETCRTEIAALLGLDSPRHVAFTLNATDSLNLLIRGVLSPQMNADRRAAQGVVATELDHNSVLRPLHELAVQGEIHLTLVPFDAQSGLIHEGQFEEALQKRPTRLVVINHASNVLGTVQRVQRLAKIAHQHGALVLLDAAQTAGHIPFSAAKLDIDFLAAPGHKSLFGPLGTGFLWIRPGLENAVQSLRTGGTGTQSEQLQQPEQMPERFESGNLNLPGIAGLLAGVRWLRENSVEAVHARITELSQRLINQLRSIPGVRIWSPISSLASDSSVSGSLPASKADEKSELDTDSTGIVAFTIEGVESHDVSMIMDQQASIASRAGLHCAPLVHQALGTARCGGVVRLSPGYFNTHSEMDQAAEVVRTIAESFAP